jgi:hypothetical protein
MPSIMDQNEYLKDVISSECSFYSAIRIPTISYCPCFLDIALSSSFLCSCRLSSAFLPACWSEREFGIASSSAHSFGPFVCTSFSALAALGCFPDLVPAAALGPSDLVCSSGPSLVCPFQHICSGESHPESADILSLRCIPNQHIDLTE